MPTLQQETHITRSADETIALGKSLAAHLTPPQLILLIGDLGTGKTTLTKGIIGGLGVASLEDVLSPTFSLIHEYASTASPNWKRSAWMNCGIKRPSC